MKPKGVRRRVSPEVHGELTDPVGTNDPDLSGGYTVIVEKNFEGEVLRWEGYAENPSDALDKAVLLREEVLSRNGIAP